MTLSLIHIYPLLLADFDRLIVGQKAGLECKTVSPFSADKWADGKIPARYMAQVNHYLAVSGFDSVSYTHLDVYKRQIQDAESPWLSAENIYSLVQQYLTARVGKACIFGDGEILSLIHI